MLYRGLKDAHFSKEYIDLGMTYAREARCNKNQSKSNFKSK